MSVITNNLLLTGDDGGYQISRSVRLRSSASASFTRTPASAGTRTIWTWSAWVKRGSLGSNQALFSADTNSGAGATSSFIWFSSSDTLGISIAAGTYYLNSTAVFRDPSAWYHLVAVYDTTQATSSNRLKLYVNGVQLTTFGTATYPTLNYTSNFNNNVLHGVGARVYQSPTLDSYFDGYQTEVNFIDGQALTPSSFGENDSITGVWKPKRYSGTYGTNGFYLNFKDPSSTTTIGYDYSGNSNNWTSNNVSVTSGVTYDSMTDVPTLTSATAANYPVANPLYRGYGGYTATPVTISNANLTITGNPSANNIAATMALPTTGQFYYEYVWTATAGGEADGGIIGDSGTSYFYRYDGTYWNGSSYVAYGASYTTNDVIGVAVDMTNLTFTFYKNGTSQGLKTSAFPSGVTYFPWFYTSNTVAISVNFGQRPFAYTPPTGFKALNTYNLPDATIKAGNKYFDATLYTGNGSSQSITNSGSMQPDLLWYKDRANISDFRLFDSVRGVTAALYSDATNAETTEASALTSFNSNGFTVGSGSGNTNTRAFVGWQWKESVSAGFDIVTFTNPSSGSSSFAHSLGVKPSMIIVKARSNTSNWTCTHKSLGTNMADKWINLESTAAVQTSSNIWGGEPTSSVFYCGTGIQVASATMVAYLFAEVAGYSKFGSYTGNGSTDGTFVYLGFRPRWVMIKRTDTVGGWYIWDTSRDTYNVMSLELKPNLSNAEDTNVDLDCLCNGFKLRRGGVDQNASGGTYIFMALAENPFKNSLAR